MTGVLMMPSGWMLPQVGLPPFAVGELPMLCVQTCAPVVSSSANTSLPVVSAKKTPLPFGPFCR